MRDLQAARPRSGATGRGAAVSTVVLTLGWSLLVLAASGSAAAREAAGRAAAPLALGRPEQRSDRLIEIRGTRADDLVAEFALAAGGPWYPATIYPGASVDAWRTSNGPLWNRAAVQGRIPAGEQPCVWNYFFDVPMPADEARLRLRAASSSRIVLSAAVDLRGARDVTVLDERSFLARAGGRLPAPWKLVPGMLKRPVHASLECALEIERLPPPNPAYAYRVRNADVPAVVLRPNLTGWHRIYLGMEPYAAFQCFLPKEGILFPVPEYFYLPDEENPSGRRTFQEFYWRSVDLTGQDLAVVAGGTRFWRNASLRFVRFVPMTAAEVAHHERVRARAGRGRPFAAYVEPCTAAHYEPETLTLAAHVRNEMRLARVRGCTDAYVHVIRIGSRAWYHSDVVERYQPTAEDLRGGAELDLKWTAWMRQGDPLSVAVREARDAGLKVFADVGMGVSYPERGLRERFAREHPETLLDGRYPDYRRADVREYALSIVRDLLGRYDLDGIHVDFARFAHRRAFDRASLVGLLRRVDRERRAAEVRLGHRVLVAARIPSYLYGRSRVFGGEYGEFVEALRVWAAQGWVDRVMACAGGYLAETRELSVGRYREAVAGTRTQLWGDLYGGGAFLGTSRSDWLELARKWVREGLDGGWFFYTPDRPTEFEQLNWQLRLVDAPGVSVDPGDR
jgi:hypothetical protein